VHKRKINNKTSSAVAERPCDALSLNILLNHSWSLNVIESGTIRKLGYSFLSHYNYGPLLYHFRDEMRYSTKIAISSKPLHSTLP